MLCKVLLSDREIFCWDATIEICAVKALVDLKVRLPSHCEKVQEKHTARKHLPLAKTATIIAADASG